jgi:hypothetical protein
MNVSAKCDAPRCKEPGVGKEMRYGKDRVLCDRHAANGARWPGNEAK